MCQFLLMCSRCALLCEFSFFPSVSVGCVIRMFNFSEHSINVCCGVCRIVVIVHGLMFQQCELMMCPTFVVSGQPLKMQLREPEALACQLQCLLDCDGKSALVGTDESQSDTPEEKDKKELLGTFFASVLNGGSAVSMEVRHGWLVRVYS
jgi:hypothetical protein